VILGDSEKLVRALFDLARHYGPSTIFIDEVESLFGHRSGGNNSDHESSKRMKTEFLVQIEGLVRTSSNITLIGATNAPWDLDPAFLRRFEKRVKRKILNL
jgi:katanin p60 ATPase-containing subunit A1